VQVRALVLRKTVLGRVAESSDMVGAAVYLASPAADYVTGHTLFVDRGWLVQ
jgi:NAD(P)-dependent dehydrogenase (short-subunit alcohol dehydrogenase family)